MEKSQLVSSMSNNLMRKIIAKNLGWNDIHDDLGKPPQDCDYYYILPNYPEDLNACHEMEKYLKYDEDFECEFSMYADLLSIICGSYGDAVKATPIQRCEAFLKTKGLWEEIDK